MPTIDKTVAAQADNGGELSSGNVQIAISSFLVDATGEWFAMRFTGITIPAGATIDVAYLTVNYDNANLDEPDLTIYGEDVASPAQYEAGTGTFTISARTRTTASVAWDSANLGAPGDFNSPSIVSIIQELIASHGPYSNGVMAFMWTSANGLGTRDAQVLAYDGSTSLCGRLHIEYTEAGGGGGNPHYAYAQQ